MPTGPGAVAGFLMELCTLTPHACGFTSSADSRGKWAEIPCVQALYRVPYLLCPSAFASTCLPESLPHGAEFLPSQHIWSRDSRSVCFRLSDEPLRAPTEIFCPLLAPLSPCPGIASDHGRSGDTPRNTDSSATRSSPLCQRGTGSSGRLMELCTLTPSRVRLHSSADSRLPLDEPPPGSTEIFCPLRSTVSMSLGSPQITVDPETPHKKILILLQHVSPYANEGPEQGRLMELCTPWTPSRVRFTSSADSRVDPRDTPQENTDSSATCSLASMPTGTGSSGR
ncbi:Nitric Oxide Synthase, Inducible [Manis pentadactyla]|nr:Nitric Oxide Synthase, Inducible [Manis pentadactyla]